MDVSGEEESNSDSKFLALANELIEYIFNLDILNHRDICHLSQACHRFHVIANSNEVWRAKATQRWRSWKHKPQVESDWKDVFKRRSKCSKEIIQHVNCVINKSFRKDCLENKDFKVFGEYCDNKDEEDIRQIENTFQGIISTNRFKMLTLKFYSRRIFVYIKQHQLTKKWCNLLCKPEQCQNLIQGTIMIAQWCSQLRDVCEESVHKQIHEIVSKVKEKVAKFEDQPESQLGIADKNYKILEAIQTVLFQEIGFCGNKQSYYDVNNSFIDKVLELHTGIPISLSIVFAAVAEKLGIHLEPVNFPMHFLLRYSPTNSSDNCKYIDAFHGGKIMDELDCIQILPYESRNTVPRHALFPTASPRQVFIRMVANIINTYRSSTIIDGRSIDKLRSALELMMLLCPDDEEHRLMLSRIYLHFGVNLDEVIENIRQLLSSTRGTMQMGLLTSLLDYAMQKRNDSTTTNVSPKYRSDEVNSDVQYYIGMVMHHKRYHYFCVIYGWDNFCNMEENWRIQMGVYNLTNGADQPFYNVLADDGSCRYASQENLVPLNNAKSSGRPIFHPDIGKYFEEFDGFRYFPNTLLARVYPEDGEIPRDLLPAKSYDKMDEIEPIDEG